MTALKNVCVEWGAGGGEGLTVENERSCVLQNLMKPSQIQVLVSKLRNGLRGYLWSFDNQFFPRTSTLRLEKQGEGKLWP